MAAKADDAVSAASARLLARQQQQIEQNPLPADLTTVDPSQVSTAVGNLFSLSNWPFWPPLPAGAAPAYAGSTFYYSASLSSLFVDDREREALAAAQAATGPPPLPGDTNNWAPYTDPGAWAVLPTTTRLITPICT